MRDSFRAVMRPAQFTMGTGETADFEFTPTETRELTLDIPSVGRVGLPPARTVVPVIVRD